MESSNLNRRQFHKTFSSTSIALGMSAITAKRSQGANDRLRIGVIGCGGRGGSHIGMLLKLREQGNALDITAVCDTYRPRLQQAAERTHAVFSTMKHEELLERSDVDVVLIATPEHWHGYQTIDALKAGKDIYVEKPLTHWRQLGLAEKVAEAAKQSGGLVQVGCQRMSCSAYTQAKELIQKGMIGKPVMAETGYFRFGDWGERGMSIDDPNAHPGPDLDWERFQGDCPRHEFSVSRYFRWRMYADTAGGPISDNYIHFYNPLAYTLGLGYPTKVAGLGGIHRYTLDQAPDPVYRQEREIPDTCNLVIEYPDRFTVTCSGTQANAFTTYGSNETPIIRGWDGTLLIGGQDIRVLKSDDSKEIHREPIQHGIDQMKFWADFLDCCRTRKQPLSNAALSAPVNTTMQMGVMAVNGERVIRYDHEQKRVIA
ncbi:MAG: Gfo/Idh/MocA family oxidoreductase [Candidatus Omnitrophica bacterium]|nr:Gfo/Idh/MocA family oxidoreductase [Candidatus Omnitrophota bacterium]